MSTDVEADHARAREAREVAQAHECAFWAITSPDPCDNCGENDNITVARYIPWLAESKMVCESCLVDDGPLFGRARSTEVSDGPTTEDYVDLGEVLGDD